MLTASEALEQMFIVSGESEDEAQRLARIALVALIKAGFVLKVRDGDVAELPADAGEMRMEDFG